MRDNIKTVKIDFNLFKELIFLLDSLKDCYFASDIKESYDFCLNSLLYKASMLDLNEKYKTLIEANKRDDDSAIIARVEYLRKKQEIQDTYG